MEGNEAGEGSQGPKGWHIQVVADADDGSKQLHLLFLLLLRPLLVTLPQQPNKYFDGCLAVWCGMVVAWSVVC